MKNTKRIITVVLAICLMFSIVPAVSAAEEIKNPLSKGDGIIDHAIVISNVDVHSGIIQYAAHSSPRTYQSLEEGMKGYDNCRVYIVKIKNDAE